MKKLLSLLSAVLIAFAVTIMIPNCTFASAKISATEYEAGDTVTIEGTIAPGKDLYIAVASQTTFAPKDTKGVHEVKRLKKEAKKRGFKDDSRIRIFYYMLTTNQKKFGKVSDKRFGGPSFIKGIYGYIRISQKQ